MDKTPKPPLRLEVIREVGRVTLRSTGFELWFEAEDITPDGETFALWAVVPLAMRLGRGVTIEGRVSPEALNHAAELTEIWEQARADVFTHCRFGADHPVPSAAAPDAAILTYSGGIDSTGAMVRLHDETDERPDLLMVHGMDYHYTDDARFAALLEQTRPVRASWGCKTRVVRTNMARVLRRHGVPADLGFGFQLAACQFLFEHRYARALTASDNALWQEVAYGPYGTNSGTTPLLRSEAMGCDLLDLDLARDAKIIILSRHPDALPALSFCKDYPTRPRNCGVCAKCVRSKVQFYAATGVVPDIFVHPGLAPRDFAVFKHMRRNDLAPLRRALIVAEKNGRTDVLGPLIDQMRRARPPSGLRYTLYRLSLQIKLWRLRRRKLGVATGAVSPQVGAKGDTTCP